MDDLVRFKRLKRTKDLNLPALKKLLMRYNQAVTRNPKGNQVNDPHRNSMADELAAMANTANGVFVLGVDDKSRTVVGIPEDKLDVVETWVREICNALITPQLFCRIRKIPVTTGENKDLCIIRVDIPRSLYVHKSPSGYFHRIGSSKREMSPEILFRLAQQRSQARIIRYDERSVNCAHRDSLDKALWKKFKTPLSPQDDEEFLLKLKLLTQDEDGNICPGVSGVLMATHQPQEIISNAFIQAVAYRGTERNAAYQLDARDIFGPLDIQMRVMNFLKVCWHVALFYSRIMQVHVIFSWINAARAYRSLSRKARSYQEENRNTD